MLTHQELTELVKQRSILESAVKKLDDVYLPYGLNCDKYQLALDGSIAKLQLLAGDITDYIVANLPPELESQYGTTN